MIKTVLLILCVLKATNTARILAVIPTPSISHQVVFRPLTQELAKRGHEVTVITTDPAFPKGKTPDNLQEIDVHAISYYIIHTFSLQIGRANEIGRESEWVSELDDVYLFLSSIVETQLKSEPVQQLINHKKEFDLLIIEAYVRPALIYSHLFKAPVIQMSSVGAMLENLEAIGAPTHPILYPVAFRQRLFNLSLWEKFRECYYQLKLMRALSLSANKEDEMFRKLFGPNTPSVNELTENVHMWFLNIPPIWANNHPVPPSVIFLGGLHQQPIKELPQDLKSYLDSSRKGVVYVSFGTNVLPVMFPPDRLKVITETLSKLPYDVLFKWNDDELPGRPENVKISKWLPQADLLKHAKVKAFLMQGGLQSTNEAVTAGVPLVCIPMIGDQWYNAEMYVKLNIGIKLDLHTLTTSKLRDAIETVISNNSYRENIVKLRDLIDDEPQTPLERAVWWTEYVIRHKGAKHLQAPAANMSWAEYYELKLVSVVLTCLLVSSTVVVYLILSLLRTVCSNLSSNGKVKRS